LAILTAQFARMYALLSLLSILSTWLFLQFSSNQWHSWRLFGLYVLVNILATFTHLAFFFLIFAQLIFQLAFFRQQAKKFVFALILTFIPYLFLWTPILFMQIGNSGGNLAWVKKPNASMALELFLLYGGAFWLFVPVLLYLWWRTGFRQVSELTRSLPAMLPVWLLIITLATPFLMSFFKPIFNSRLAIVGLAPFVLTVGGIIGTRSNYLLMTALVLATAAFMIVVHPVSTPCDNRELARYLSQNAKDGDAVIFTSLTRQPIDYYLERFPQPPNLFEKSFPAEIDKHPGYEGRFAGAGPLEREAAELVERIEQSTSTNKSQRIFFFHGVHPEVNSIVEKPLAERFALVTDHGRQCTDSSPYVKQLSIYQASK
jgi:hypothetical protein